MIAAFLRHSLFLIAATAVGLLITVVGASADERECPVPERFYEFEPLVTKTAKALAGRREVVIAVLGGASTMGVAAGGLEGRSDPGTGKGKVKARKRSGSTRSRNPSNTQQNKADRRPNPF